MAAISITSCGKTTKGKITNEWRVVAYYVDVINGDTVSGSSTGDGVDTPNRLTIDKDGTFTWTRGETTHGVVFGGSVYQTHKESMTQSGTWSFVGRTRGDDFKKNERLLFTILSESKISSQTGGGNNPVFPDTTISSTQTYLTGEKVMIYTVVKSTKDELRLESESSHTSSSNGTTSSQKIKVLLKAEK